MEPLAQKIAYATYCMTILVARQRHSVDKLFPLKQIATNEFGSRPSPAHQLCDSAKE